MSMRLRVLIVEDSDEDALLLLHTLRQGGIEPEYERVDTLEGLKAALSKPAWDIVLSDYQLPRFTGLEALKLIREKDPDLPFILISGTVGEEFAVEAMRQGANDYFLKGGLVRLVPVVRREVREAAERRGRRQAEEALRKSERIIRGVFDQTFQFIGLVTTDGILVEANRTALEFSGVEAAAVLNKPFWQGPWWAHSLELQEALRQAVAKAARGEFVHFEATHVAKDGSLHYVDFSLKPVRDESGAVLFLIPEGRDITERKHVEEALRESERFFHSVLDDMFTFLAVLKPDGEILYVNKAPLHVIGKSLAQVQGTKFYDAEWWSYSEDLCRTIKEDLERCASGERVFREVRIRTRDGFMWIDFGVHAIRDADGRLQYLIPEGRDISERKRAEEASRASEGMYRSLVETTNTGYLILDGEGRVVDANQEYVRLTGHRELREILGRSVLEWTADYERRKNADAVARCLKDGRIRNFVIDYVDAQGRITPVEINATVRGEGGSLRIISLCRDITESRRVEAALKLQNTILSTQQDVSIDGILVVDAEGKILSFNRRFIEIWGIPPALVEAGIDEPVLRMVVEQQKDPEAFIRRVRYLYEHRGEKSRDELATKDGRIIDRYSAPMEGPGGRYLGRVWSFRDITERKRTEDTLAHMQRLESLGTLAGGIAHDFNNILTAILGNLSLLTSEAKIEGDALELVREAQAACGTAKGLSHQLLTFAKGGRPIVKVVNLQPLLTRAAGFAARGSNTRCVFELGDTPLVVSVDKEQISQVVQNLVLNAVQAMSEGGEIVVRAAPVALSEGERPPLPSGRYVRVEVEDGGPGIAPAHLPMIFDPYFSTKGTGRGLGLAVCYSILAKHGGSIYADSRPGGGAVFTLYLPAADVAELAPEGEPPEPAAGNGRVLIMEDEEAVARILKRLLERLGYAAECVGDGRAALDAYVKASEAGAPYDVVLMDLTIPGGMGGKEAIAKLKALHPEAKVVVSSGYSNDPVMAEYSAHGFCAALSKPYCIEEVAQTMSRALGSVRR